MNQRTTSLLLGAYALVSLSLTPITFAAFRDVSANASYSAAIQNLQNKGIIEGYADGSFKPTVLVNRAEFLKMVMKAAGKDALPEGTDHKCFSDFRGSEQWFWVYACAAKEAGLINGYPDGSFRGTTTVNLAEALKISVRAWNVPEPVFIRAPDNWYDPFFIATESYTRLFDVVPREQPSRLLSRGETAAVIDAFLNGGTAMCGGHQVGDSYPSSDGCNSCSCTESGEICTLRACVDKKCTSSNDCSENQYCTTEDGDCMSICHPGAEACPAVCAGVCRARSSSSTQANACAPKREAFDAAVSANTSCNTNADCTIAVYGCPYLTCGVAINKSGSAAVDASATAYESCTEQNDIPVACAKCAQVSVSCVSGKCVAK